MRLNGVVTTVKSLRLLELGDLRGEIVGRLTGVLCKEFSVFSLLLSQE